MYIISYRGKGGKSVRGEDVGEGWMVTRAGGKEDGTGKNGRY
jgi:hypothetical protein